MNRRIRNQLKIIRDSLDVIDFIMSDYEQAVKEGAEEEELVHIGDIDDLEAELSTTNWTTADEPEKEGVYFSQLKDLESLKDITIMGQITKVFDLKSYVGKEGKPGLIYRFVLTESDKPHNDIVAITFDEMAGELKQHMIGTRLKITNAWKVQKNKDGVIELHLGNFAKVEVVE